MATWYDLWCADVLTFAEFRALRARGDEPATAFARARDEGDDLAADIDGIDVLLELAHDGRTRADRALAGACVPDAHPVDLAGADRRIATATPSAFAIVAGALPEPCRRPVVAVVGTRAIAGDDARRARAFLADILGQLDVCVVSGGARGIDTLAHEVAMDAGRPVVVVLAGGIGHAGPASNRRAFAAIAAAGGAVITTRPPHCAPQPYEFVRRNRLIASLADVTLVVRAPRTSGALVTASDAFELGRPVLAVPGRPDDLTSAGCHALMRRGARICCGAEDLAAALGGGALPLTFDSRDDRNPAAAVPDDLRAILDEIDHTGTLMDELSDRMRLSAAATAERVLELELGGWVERRGAAVVRVPRRS